MTGVPENLNALSSGRRTERYGLALNRLGERYVSAYRQLHAIRLGPGRPAADYNGERTLER